jgi:ABC-type glycerol-3-phosphate transport system substrate-binding protein
MKRIAASILAVGLAAAVAAGCGGAGSGSSANGGSGTSGEAYSPNINPADFTTTIDNRYFP